MSFEDLSQGKIKTLQKNNFAKGQFREIAKKLKTITPYEFTNKLYVLNKQTTKLSFIHQLLFFPQSLPGTNFLPEIKNSTLSEPSGTRLITTGLDDGSEMVIGIFKNRFRMIFLLLEVTSIGKWLFICFKTFQHFLAFKSLFIWSRNSKVHRDCLV